MTDRPLTYSVVNLGCKVNRVESDAFEALLETRACEAVPEEADIIVVNTCTVTGEAEKKTRKTVRHLLRGNDRARVVVTGCAAAIDPDVFEAMDPRVSCVAKADVATYLEGLGFATDAFSAPGRMRAGVKVQDGCDHACTYCIVHVARGAARSMEADGIVDHCLELARAGIPEIVLTGINLGSYERDGLTLAGLIRHITDGFDRMRLPKCGDDVTFKGPRLRLSSIEPMDVDDALIESLAEGDGRICRHLHLPLQSGSTKVLREMNRPYGAEDFEALVRRIRTAVPRLSLSTDVIVGFPGETDEDFADTVALARACAFSGMHIFPYSMRRGTPAAERADQVPAALKDVRAKELRAVAAHLTGEDQARREGTWEWAAVEEPGFARTESYHRVEVPENARAGSLVRYAFEPCGTM